jgi:hypothetical protein
MKNLITAADITALTAANLSVEAHRLEITIPQAQARHLRPLLGLQLYADLLAFTQGAPDVPGPKALAAELTAYATALDSWRTSVAADPLLALFDQVKPMLAQWGLIEAWPNLLVHVANAGVVLQTGNQNGTTTADAATLNQVYTRQRETAVWLSEEIVQWLERNKAAYPAYVSTRPLVTARQPIDTLGGISL